MVELGGLLQNYNDWYRGWSKYKHPVFKLKSRHVRSKLMDYLVDAKIGIERKNMFWLSDEESDDVGFYMPNLKTKDEVVDFIEEISDFFRDDNQYIVLYVPTLRGWETFEFNEDVPFAIMEQTSTETSPSTRTLNFKGLSNDIFDIAISNKSDRAQELVDLQSDKELQQVITSTLGKKASKLLNDIFKDLEKASPKPKKTPKKPKSKLKSSLTAPFVLIDVGISEAERTSMSGGIASILQTKKIKKLMPIVQHQTSYHFKKIINFEYFVRQCIRAYKWDVTGGIKKLEFTLWFTFEYPGNTFGVSMFLNIGSHGISEMNILEGEPALNIGNLAGKVWDTVQKHDPDIANKLTDFAGKNHQTKKEVIINILKGEAESCPSDKEAAKKSKKIENNIEDLDV